MHPARAAATQAGIQILSPLEIPDWDARLGHFPAATFFHRQAWARVLHETYGYAPIYHATCEANRITSLLPLMAVNSWLTGRRGISLPFTDHCEPLGTDTADFPRLFTAAQAEARRRGWKYLECRGGRALLGNAPASTSYYQHTLELQPDESALLAKFDSSVRRAVRKAGQSGLTVEFSQNLDAMQTFYGLHCLTRQRQGVPPQPFRLFANIQRHVLAKNQGWVVLACHGQIPVAGAVFFHSGNSAIYKFGASDKNVQPLRANHLVMWEAIRHYTRASCTTLDFGRTSLANPGLRRFKLSWGTRERQIDYMRYNLSADCFITARDESAGWHNHVFRMLPVFLSRLIGAALYKHIA